MASTTKLELTFGTMSGEKKWTFNYFDSEATASSVKALMNGMIANGSIYSYPPLTRVKARRVVTTDTEYDISD